MRLWFKAQGQLAHTPPHTVALEPWRVMKTKVAYMDAEVRVIILMQEPFVVK